MAICYAGCAPPSHGDRKILFGAAFVCALKCRAASSVCATFSRFWCAVCRNAQLAGREAWATVSHTSLKLDEPESICSVNKWLWALTHTTKRFAALGIGEALANLREAFPHDAQVARGQGDLVQRALADARHGHTRRVRIISRIIISGLSEANVDNGGGAFLGALKRVTAFAVEGTLGCHHLALLCDTPNVWWEARAITRETPLNIDELF